MTNLAITIHSLDFDVLVRTSEVPEPIALLESAGIPINPMVFNHDWSVECEIETRWLTDVTKSVDQHEDRWVLANRPNRTISMRIVGGSKAESEAILQSAVAASNQFGFPVPIYPDGVQVDALGNNGIVFGNFAHRRFYRGARVAVLDGATDPLKSSESARFATVENVAPDGLDLIWDQGYSEQVEEGQHIYPCMDVEMSAEASGVALTDGVYAVELKWTEVDGSSTLPASWPFDTRNAEENLAPLCSVIDGFGVFPFEPNWVDEVEITTRRLIDTDRMGRTSVQTPTGEAFLEFRIPVMGYDRERCWRVARFFDAHRGRGRGFWLEHPMKPWSARTSNQTSVEIDGVGTPEGLAQSYQKVIITCQDGTRHIRPIEWNNQQPSGHFWLGWSTPVPDTIVSAQPVFLCRFDQDVLTETWSTNEVQPSIDLKIVEEPKESAKVTIGDLGFNPGDSNFTELGNCTLLLRAGVRCFDAAGRPALPFPSTASNARRWEDASRPPERDGEPESNRPYFTTTDSNCQIAIPNIAFRNNGQPFMFNPAMEGTFFLDENEPINERQLWDTEMGWTICLVITPTNQIPLPGVFNKIAFNFASAGEFAANWVIDSDTLANGWRSYISIGPVGNIHVEEVTTTGMNNGTPIVMCIRHGGSAQGNLVRAWVNGRPACASFSTPLADVTGLTTARLFTGFEWWGTSTSSITNNWLSGKSAANMVVSYKEAMSWTNIRALHSTISRLYQLGIDAPTFY